MRGRLLSAPECSLGWAQRALRPTAFFALRMIATKVSLTPEAAERWIVNLIRNARLGESSLDAARMACLRSLCSSRACGRRAERKRASVLWCLCTLRGPH